MQINRNPFWVVLAFSLMACAGSQGRQAAQLPEYPVVNKPVIPATQAECKRAGGEWGLRTYLGSTYVCHMLSRDAGNPCTDSTQCEGACVVLESEPIGKPALGQCDDAVGLYGCRSSLKDHVVQRTCVE